MGKFNEEVCVVCGAPVPEGRQICPNCEEKYFGNKKDNDKQDDEWGEWKEKQILEQF